MFIFPFCHANLRKFNFLFIEIKSSHCIIVRLYYCLTVSLLEWRPVYLLPFSRSIICVLMHMHHFFSRRVFGINFLFLIFCNIKDLVYFGFFGSFLFKRKMRIFSEVSISTLGLGLCSVWFGSVHNSQFLVFNFSGFGRCCDMQKLYTTCLLMYKCAVKYQI